MASKLDFQFIDEIVGGITAETETSPPGNLYQKIQQWQWGKYGWASPSNLIITAAWRKALYPELDCCAIWASDDAGKPILGGYSIRSEDETVTVPILAKYDLCRNFCSPNSGMQGSRAIEKMRSLKRVNRQFELGQKVSFNSELFAEILNDINECNSSEALEVFKTLIVKARVIQDERFAQDVEITLPRDKVDIFNKIETINDPEFPKCVAAACLQVIYEPHGFEIVGIDSYQTAADTRAEKPGDLSLSRDGEFGIAVEIKDRSRHLGWQNVGAAREIIKRFPDLKLFLFVLESPAKVFSEQTYTVLSNESLDIKESFQVIGLSQLVSLALPISGEAKLSILIGKNLSMAPSIKEATKTLWLS